jgi:hypothetical protein
MTETEEVAQLVLRERQGRQLGGVPGVQVRCRAYGLGCTAAYRYT